MVENLKDLEKLFKLCRKQGIAEMTLKEMSFKLGDLPKASQLATGEEQEIAEDLYTDFPDGELTPEELTFFANGGLPEDNPYRGRN